MILTLPKGLEAALRIPETGMLFEQKRSSSEVIFNLQRLYDLIQENKYHGNRNNDLSYCTAKKPDQSTQSDL